MDLLSKLHHEYLIAAAKRYNDCLNEEFDLVDFLKPMAPRESARQHDGSADGDCERKSSPSGIPCL